MKKCKVPQWYIDSCLKIQYMFPKAHAAAYVISAVRTAYFKLYHPIEYYATYFTVRAEEFDIELVCQGYDAIYRKIEEIEQLGIPGSAKGEKYAVLFLRWHWKWQRVDSRLNPLICIVRKRRSSSLTGKSLIPPFSALAGIGDNAARNIAAARDQGEFLSIEDFQQKSKASKTIVELLSNMGCFRGLPESNQLSLF